MSEASFGRSIIESLIILSTTDLGWSLKSFADQLTMINALLMLTCLGSNQQKITTEQKFPGIARIYLVNRLTFLSTNTETSEYSVTAYVMKKNNMNRNFMRTRKNQSFYAV